MKKNRAIFLVTILCTLLGLCTAAYAAITVGGTSTITTGLITVTGKSTTTVNQGTEVVQVICSLYRDGVRQDFSAVTASQQKQISTNTSGSNQPGLQMWEVFGSHCAYNTNPFEYDGANSYAIKYY